jgi:hypothetical protein
MTLGVVSDRILDGVLQIHEYLTTLLDALHSRSEVVIKKNHIGSLFRHVRAGQISSQCREIPSADFTMLDGTAAQLGVEERGREKWS